MDADNSFYVKSIATFFGYIISILAIVLKFMFSKEATQIDEIFNVDLTVTTTVNSTMKILSIFVAFLENKNFNHNFMMCIYRISLFFQRCS